MPAAQELIHGSAISTYSNRGTNKQGCRPEEHSIAYFPGTDPRQCYLLGEYENGMIKEPIEIQPASSSLQMNYGSRIRFSKKYPIEMNVKVKNIGRVVSQHLSKLLEYYTQYQY